MAKAAKKEEKDLVVNKGKDVALKTEMEEAMAQRLAAIKDRISAPPSNRISTKGKLFSLPGGESSPGPMQVVVLNYIWEMVYFPGVFNSNAPVKPVCWAVGQDKPESGLLAPSAEAPEPQGDNCATCPKNAWKSSPTGGKACKNQIKLMLTSTDATEATSPMTLFVSPAALKHWNAYVLELSREGLDPIQVITEISFDATQTYPNLRFKNVGKHDNMPLYWGLSQKHVDVLTKEPEAA